MRSCNVGIFDIMRNMLNESGSHSYLQSVKPRAHLDTRVMPGQATAEPAEPAELVSPH